MRRLRRIAPLLAVLLALVVGGEVTDALPCAEADCGMWIVLLDGAPPPPDDGAPAPAACLCQVTFVSTAALPAAPGPTPEAGALGGADPPPLLSSTGRVPHPPPRS